MDKNMIEKKLSFTEIKDLGSFLKDKTTDSNKYIFNFINSHDLFFFAKDTKFRDTFKDRTINFIDGFVVSLFLSLKNLRRIRRLTGPDFTKQIFENKILPNSRQLFIGLESDDLKKILKKYPYLRKENLFSYNPPHIKGVDFSESEIKKIAQIINSKNIDYIWIGLGCPKQNFLTDKLFNKTKFFFNVGAGLDFLLEKKKRAPKIFSILGLEWFYRLVTDFNHSKSKVLRSLKAIIYLRYVE
jgi:N-acetylglucosaminyldiphosphoundecaprenol N-acetyl-beta-D-mannosaminyltransferase